jgi:hypothetical protein
MLVASADGDKVVIHSVYDDDYCLKIANAMKLQARFKTSSRKIKGKKTGEYNFWSVISLIVDSMQEGYEHDQEELLIEVSIMRKIGNFVRGTWSKVSSYFKKGASKLYKFLGATPIISTKKNIRF